MLVTFLLFYYSAAVQLCKHFPTLFLSWTIKPVVTLFHVCRNLLLYKLKKKKKKTERENKKHDSEFAIPVPKLK